MTAQAKNRAIDTADWRYKRFTLTSGSIAYKSGAAFLNLATGKVVPALQAAAGHLFLGVFAEQVNATSGDKPVNVDLGTEVNLMYFVNSGPILATDVGKLCYFDDDQTVVLAAGTRQLAGRVLDVDARKGVGVDIAVARYASQERTMAGPALAFVANDAAPTDVINGAVYNLPATAGASTVTLPAAAADGVIAFFAADGTANGHTVTYRDATGPVALTTALVASKRHLTVATKVNGKWVANAYVSP